MARLNASTSLEGAQSSLEHLLREPLRTKFSVISFTRPVRSGLERGHQLSRALAACLTFDSGMQLMPVAVRGQRTLGRHLAFSAGEVTLHLQVHYEPGGTAALFGQVYQNGEARQAVLTLGHAGAGRPVESTVATSRLGYFGLLGLEPDNYTLTVSVDGLLVQVDGLFLREETRDGTRHG